MINRYTQNYQTIWNNCPDVLPGFSRTYSPDEKEIRQQKLDICLNELRKTILLNKQKADFNQIKNLMLAQAQFILGETMDFPNEEMDMLFSPEFQTVTKRFVNQAREFDPGMSYPDIFQACRNVWIMNGLQLLMGIPVALTPPVFAYSMLYPYTDNFIDNPGISNHEKQEFSQRFYARLAGTTSSPGNATEQSIFALVEMIEAYYPRHNFPKVYESLLDIHRAQTESMNLVGPGHPLSGDEVLKICLNKGGASVIADGYLVAGDLTDLEQHFLYGYGAYLQLLDDIQDAKDDLNGPIRTVFSDQIRKGDLDCLVNKTYWFGDEVMKSLPFFKSPCNGIFKALMRKSMDLFIIEAIAQFPDAFSDKYLQETEPFSPFSFDYIRKRKQSMEPYRELIFSYIESYFRKNRTKKKWHQKVISPG